jgi:RNA polymerase sigma-70 factor, ECF subfamily
MDEQTQREIAEGLRTGKPAAWLRLHQVYARRLWLDVARVTGPDSAAVADIVQETFLAAARSAGGFDPGRGTLWNWLWGIARNQVALHYRKAGPGEELRRAKLWWASLNGQQRELLSGESEGPSARLESQELTTLVRNTLAQLPADYQMLLVAKYMDEAPTARIASEIGISPSAVDSRLARARHAFRRAFARLTRSSRVARQVRT